MEHDISESELREQYARTGLEAALGITFERARDCDVIRLSLINGIRARRRMQARRAAAGLHVHHAQQEAA